LHQVQHGEGVFIQLLMMIGDNIGQLGRERQLLHQPGARFAVIDVE